MDLMDPAAVEKILLYSEPHGFQKLKQNSTNTAQCILKVTKGSILAITASYRKPVSKKISKSAVHAKIQTKKVKIVRDSSVRAINSLVKN